MGLTYFKRYRMEVDLHPDRPRSEASAPYQLVAWDETLLEAHAEAKYLSFRAEIDSSVFPCLGNYAGCLRLMDEISRKTRFVREATWLAVCRGPRGDDWQPCGTIQGLRETSGFGAIQNLGVLPEHRGCGLGTLLLEHALCGFRRAGLDRAYLEVTAQNEPAVRLYERIGFRRVQTAYKAVEAAYS